VPPSTSVFSQTARQMRCDAGNLFMTRKESEGQPMLFIALGLVVRLVAADFLDLSRRGAARSRGLTAPK